MTHPEALSPAQLSLIDSFSLAMTAEAIGALKDQLPKIPKTKKELLALKEATTARLQQMNTVAAVNINNGLDFLQTQLDERLRQLEQRPIDGVGNMIGDAVSATGNVVAEGIKASGVQAGKAFGTVKQFVDNEAEAWKDKSGWERAKQVGGLTALAIIVGYPLYKLAEKISNAGKKEGEEPGGLRKFLKYTGLLALSTAAVNFLGPRVLAAQSSDATKGQTTAKEADAKSTEKSSTPETPTKTFEFAGKKVGLIERANGKYLNVQGKTFKTYLGWNDVSDNLVSVEAEGSGLKIKYKYKGFKNWSYGEQTGEVILDTNACAAIANALVEANKSIKLRIPDTEKGKQFTFTPEKSS